MRTSMILLGSTFGCAAAGGLAFGYFRRDMLEIERKLAASSRVACTPLGRIEYARKGSGLPVLAIHGAGGGFDQGLGIAEDLFGSGYDLIAPSRFGYLGTPVPDDISPAAQADAHAALLDYQGVERAIVVAASAGAPSAIELAIRHPARVSALILLVPRAYAPGATISQRPLQSRMVYNAVRKGSDFAFWLACRVARPSVVHFLGVPPEVDARASQSERDRLTGIMRSILPLSRRLDGLNVDGATKVGPWPLNNIAAPTLVISARDDLYGTLPLARYTAAQIPNAQLMVLGSGGHLMVGRTAQVRARVATFLERLGELPQAMAA